MSGLLRHGQETLKEEEVIKTVTNELAKAEGGSNEVYRVNKFSGQACKLS